ncbi:uncharacterized protein LOC120679456 [Panicum virgatum]|uniref:uncharacterized protein LOC120679456 n=1 Tax=Panicum virgatum TaxID=38727 RepID=UPI0019D4F39C|nr:uncharacterized protein LOC120679456 [Panicum virgatum]
MRVGPHPLRAPSPSISRGCRRYQSGWARRKGRQRHRPQRPRPSHREERHSKGRSGRRSTAPALAVGAGVAALGHQRQAPIAPAFSPSTTAQAVKLCGAVSLNTIVRRLTCSSGHDQELELPRLDGKARMGTTWLSWLCLGCRC